MLNEFLEPEYVYVLTHDCYRQDNETHEVLAVFKKENEAETFMLDIGESIRKSDYEDKINYDCLYGSEIYRIRENDISCMITQEDVLKITKIKYYGEYKTRNRN